MECKEFRKSIPEFVAMSLGYDGMAQCLSHVKACPACRDELEIYFIVERGIKDNEAFDGPFVLKNIVDECFARAQRKINMGRRRRRLSEIFRIIIYIVLLVAVIAIVTYFL